MKKNVFYLIAFLIFISCDKEEYGTEQVSIEDNNKLLTIEEINKIIDNSVESTGDFLWAEQEINVIWSALEHSDNMLTIGYGENDDHFQRDKRSQDLANEIVNLIQEHESISSKSEFLIDKNEDINVMEVYVKNKETLKTLLSDKRVRYVEPEYDFYGIAESDMAKGGLKGCVLEGQRFSSADYKIVAPGAMVPWNFYDHNITKAWQYSTGKGVTIAVIDTGLSEQNFNNGFSTGKTIVKYGTVYYPASDDHCGHGTNMASAALAPLNDDNMPVGVAYDANLVSYRAMSDPWLNTRAERRSVEHAFLKIAKRKDIKIISMSAGKIFTNRRIKDAIRYAYKYDKLIFTAAGSSTAWSTKLFYKGVVFPARMDETVAVTGVRGDKVDYKRCAVCHQGKKVDFTIRMQHRRKKPKKATVPTLGVNDGDANYRGGSSVATAITAGIAALIWEKHPNWSREQVLQKLKESSDFYPNRHKKFGYGNIDALKAVQ